MFAFTAAHLTFALGSRVRVTHLASNRSVVVRINDRGPYIRGRAIDLSFAAAARLGMLDQGSAAVEVETIPAEPIAARVAVPGAVAIPPTVTLAVVTDSSQPDMPATPNATFIEDPAGHFVQLGAFKSAANADRLFARYIYRSEELPGPLRVVQKNGVHRVLAGPFRTRAIAIAAAHQLPAAP